MGTSEFICTCKQCQKNFPATSKRFKVCSPACQAILDAAYVRPPRPTITLTCQHCTETVTRTAVRYDQGKYCSRACSYAARTAASKKPVPKAPRTPGRASIEHADRVCIVCAATFSPCTKGYRFCSEACEFTKTITTHTPSKVLALPTSALCRPNSYETGRCVQVKR